MSAASEVFELIEEVAPPLIILQPPSDSVGEEDKVAAWLSGPVDQGSVPASALSGFVCQHFIVL